MQSGSTSDGAVESAKLPASAAGRRPPIWRALNENFRVESSKYNEQVNFKDFECDRRLSLECQLKLHNHFGWFRLSFLSTFALTENFSGAICRLLESAASSCERCRHHRNTHLNNNRENLRIGWRQRMKLRHSLRSVETASKQNTTILDHETTSRPLSVHVVSVKIWICFSWMFWQRSSSRHEIQELEIRTNSHHHFSFQHFTCRFEHFHVSPCCYSQLTIITCDCLESQLSLLGHWPPHSLTVDRTHVRQNSSRHVKPPHDPRLNSDS